MPQRGVPPFARPQVGAEPTSQDFTRLVEQTDRVLTELSSNRRPQLSSELLEGNTNRSDLGGIKAIQLLATDVNLVVHGLGRACRGWRVTRIFGAAMVYEEPNSGEDLAKYLPLRATDDVLIHLEVF